MIASPAPNKKRTSTNRKTAPAIAGETAAVSAVKMPHQMTPAVSTTRGPRRSASQPPSV